MKLRSKILLIIGVIINIFIWTNSLLPASVSSSQSGFVADILYPPFEDIVELNKFSQIIRKLAHFTEFMFLGIVFCLFYLSIGKNKYYFITLIHGLIVAIIDETIQLFIPGRAGLITDVLIDTSGVIFGILLIVLTKLIIYGKILKDNKKIKGEQYGRK